METGKFHAYLFPILYNHSKLLIMNKYLLILFLLGSLFFSNKTFSQDGLRNTRHYNAIQIADNKKPAYYSKRMKQAQERGFFLKALSSAFFLKKTGKKRHVKKADKFLAENFEQNISSVTAIINDLEENTKTFTNELTAQNASKLVSIYKNMVYLNQLIDSQGDKFKKVNDYSNHITKAEEVKADYYKKTAQLFFDEVVKNQSTASSKEDYKLLVNKLFSALSYDRRDDIAKLHQELKPLAVTSLGIGLVTDQVNISGISKNVIRETVYNKISTGIKPNRNARKPMPPLPFFKLVTNDIAMTPTGADVLVEVTVTKVNFENVVDEPSSKDVSESEGDGENKKIYKAKFITYGKRARVVMEGTYVIKDRLTGKVVRSDSVTGNYAWIEHWYKYTGDIKGLSKQEKHMIESKELPYPSKMELTQSAVNYDNACFAQKVGIKVLEYIREIGK